MKNQAFSDSDSEELIPDEFSDDADDIGYEAVEEKFQPRESISSRGGGGREQVRLSSLMHLNSANFCNHGYFPFIIVI